MAKRKSSTRTKADTALVTTEETRKCKARTKTCRQCGYRYEGGDKSWECPSCGEPRKCTNNAVEPYSVCRVHGAGGGRPPIHGKFSIPNKYLDRFNEIRKDPELMSLAYNIALSETRTDELLQQIDENDATAAHVDLMKAITGMEHDVMRLENFINEMISFGVAEEKAYKKSLAAYEKDQMKYTQAKAKGDKKIKPPKAPKEPKTFTFKEVREMMPSGGFNGIFMGMGEIRQAVEPRNIESHLWRDVSFHLELTRRLNDTERKWATAHDQLIPITIALEAIRTVMRDALELIVAPKDRQRFSNKIKGYLGE